MQLHLHCDIADLPKNNWHHGLDTTTVIMLTSGTGPIVARDACCTWQTHLGCFPDDNLFWCVLAARRTAIIEWAVSLKVPGMSTLVTQSPHNLWQTEIVGTILVSFSTCSFGCSILLGVTTHTAFSLSYICMSHKERQSLFFPSCNLGKPAWARVFKCMLLAVKLLFRVQNFLKNHRAYKIQSI